MSLLVEVEEAVMEVVQHAYRVMLANRLRLFGRRGGEESTSTRPRAQRRRFNASQQSYRRPEPAAFRSGQYEVAVGWVKQEGSAVTATSGDGTASVTAVFPAGETTDSYTGDPGGLDLTGLPIDGEGRPYYVKLPTESEGSYPNMEAGGGGVIDNTNPDAITQTRYQTGGDTVSHEGEYILPAGKDGLIYVRVVSSASWMLQQYGGMVYDGPDFSGGARLFGREQVTMTTAWGAVCFLITRSFVREIATPSGLVSCLRRLHPLPPASPATDTGIHGSISAGKYNMGNPIVDFTVTYKRYSEEQRNAINPLRSAIDISILRQDGIGLLGTNAHQGDYGTPTVFGFLTDTRDPGTYPTRIRYYAEVPGNLAASWDGGRPPKYLGECVVTGSCQPGFLDFDVTNTAPVDYYAAMDEALFIQRRVRTIPLPEMGPSFQRVAAWDWGRPGYCREQLLSLGFTEEDLTLPPSTP